MNVLEVSLLDFLEQLILTFGAEWIVTLQHYIKKNAQRPHICVYGTVICFGDNLRCHVGRSSTESINSIGSFTPETEPKINEFELTMSIDQNVLSFDVAMNNVPLVQIEKCLRNDNKKLFSFILR